MSNTTAKIAWDHYFLCQAIFVSTQSVDPRTKCGSVIVKDKVVIGQGFNGPVKGVLDNLLPLQDLDKKNTFFIHSEINAINHSTKPLKGSTIYITGVPCVNCLQMIYHVGIRDLIYTDWSKPKMCDNKEYETNFETFIKAIPGYDPIHIRYLPLGSVNIQPFFDITNKLKNGV